MTDLAEVDRPSKVAGDTVPLVLAGALLAVLMTVTFAVSACGLPRGDARRRQQVRRPVEIDLAVLRR